MTSRFVVAVDGPAGSGKSSVCRMAAQRLGFDYLDTGAGYRAFALHWLANGRANPVGLISTFDYQITTDPTNQVVTLSGRDVTSEIRLDSTSEAVSAVAPLPAVRQLQQADATERVLNSRRPGIIVEGRDITTVVFPSAQLRLVLTASEQVRMQRRGLQDAAAEVEKTVMQRDAQDLRVVDFMNPAPGVELLDTTNLSLAESVDALVAMIESCREDVR